MTWDDVKESSIACLAGSLSGRPTLRRSSTDEGERVFGEKISGATADRPQLKKLMAAAGFGNVAIIPAVDRPSRDTMDLLVIARYLQKAAWAYARPPSRLWTPHWASPS